MQSFRWYYAGFPLITTLVCLFLAFSLFSASAQEYTDPEAEKEAKIKAESVYVTTQSINSDQSFYLDLLGTVEAENQVMVYPATSGQVTSVNIMEGERVSRGDVLFVLGGVDDTDHPSIMQYNIAQANYNAAKKAYNGTLDSTGAAVRSAELQLNSAKNQTESFYIDHQSLGQSVETTMDSVGLLRNSLSETQTKNRRDLSNMLDDIRDMEESLYDFDDDSDDAIRELWDQIDDAPDRETREQLEDLLEDTIDALDEQEDALEDGLRDMENGYKAMQSGYIVAENQMLSQLRQTQAQEHTLNMNQDSMQWRLGLFDGSSDPVKLANQGVLSARAQSNIALAQGESSLEIARLNLEMAGDQKKYLLVKAPIDGVAGEINIRKGDTVAPSMSVTQIVGEEAYLLKVGVDLENALRLSRDSKAEVLIGGRYIKTSVRSISPSADSMSKLVNVTLKLPKIALKPNQTLSVRLEVMPESGVEGKSIFVPLDALTIATEEQFLFVLEGDKARKVVVELGNINGDVVEVLDGLEGNEEIIVDGAKDVKDGQTVTLN